MKNLPEKRNMVDKSDPKLSVSKQCIILGINRTGLYYKPKGESKLNLELMRLMDEHYLEHSFKGARRKAGSITTGFFNYRNMNNIISFTK